MSRSGGRALVALCLVATAVGGCATVARDAGFGELQQAIDARIGQHVDWKAEAPVDPAITDPIRELLRQELAVDRAVQIALLNNRRLQATYEELGIARADLVQAGLLKNPVLSIERRFSGQALEIDVVEEFVDLLLIPLRKRVAGAAFEAAKLRVTHAVLDLAADVQSTFYALQAAGQMVEMRRRVVDSTDASAELAQRLREAGNVTELEFRMEQRLARQARLDLASVEEEVTQERERMNVLMGLWGLDTVWTIATRLPDLPASMPPQAGLETRAMLERLDLAAARQEVIEAAERLGLTDVARFVPGVELASHFEREPDGGSSVGPSLHLVLPIFDWGQAAVPRERALLKQKQQLYIALAAEIRSEVRAAFSRMRTARARAEFYRDTVLPLQSAILEQSLLQYNAMQLSPLGLFEAKQDEIDAAREYIEAQRDYWVAQAELERAVGGRLRADLAAAEPAPSPPANEPFGHNGHQSH